MHQSDSADEQVLNILYDRLESVAQDMANVQQHEFNDAMKEDVLGELADLVDIEEVLAEAANNKLERTRERINEALERAKSAASAQKELFEHAASFDSTEVAGELAITLGHLQAFIEGMGSIVGYEILEKTHKGQVWKIKLSDRAMDTLGVSRTRYTLTFDRALAAKRPDWLPVNLDNWLFKALLKLARNYDFGGITVFGQNYCSGALVAAVARWQNDRGRRARQELAVVGVENGVVTLNPAWFGQWLIGSKAPCTGVETEKQGRKTILEHASKRIEQFIAKQSTQALLPDQMQWISAGCCVGPNNSEMAEQGLSTSQIPENH